MELILVKWLTLRAGYEWRPTSAQPEYYDLTYALPDLQNFGTGLGIHLTNGLDIDFAFAYIVNESFSVPNNSSRNLNSTSFVNPVYSPYAGLDYEQETINYLFSFKISFVFN
jgi:long-subunit fatty acid transport protein